MLRRSLPIILLLALLIVELFPLIAHAQDSTPESTPVVTVTPAPTPAPVLTPDNAISVSTLIYGLIVAVIGGGSVGLIITKFGGNKQNLDAAEKLYQSLSPDSQAHIRKMFEDVRDIALKSLELVDKVTDGQPNVDMLSKQVALSDKYLGAEPSIGITAPNSGIATETIQAILDAAKTAPSQ